MLMFLFIFMLFMFFFFVAVLRSEKTLLLNVGKNLDSNND